MAVGERSHRREANQEEYWRSIKADLNIRRSCRARFSSQSIAETEKRFTINQKNINFVVCPSWRMGRSSIDKAVRSVRSKQLNPPAIKSYSHTY